MIKDEKGGNRKMRMSNLPPSEKLITKAGGGARRRIIEHSDISNLSMVIENEQS